MVKKGVEKRGVKSGYNSGKLSSQQSEILYLLTKEYLTPKKIAIKRGTHISAVYKIINKLKKKGVLNGTSNRGYKKNIPTHIIKKPKSLKSFKKYIRLHAQEWNIKILYKTNFYEELRQKGNTLEIDNNKVRLYKNSIEIYSKKDFCAEDEQRATTLSFQYWDKFFTRLENHFKIIIIKNRKHNIKLVSNHYAEVNNELAKEYNLEKKKLNIYTTDDGRLWFTIDYSFNENEAETLHKDTAKQDMGKVKRVFNDYRNNNSYLPSEVKGMLDQIIMNVHKFTEENLILSNNFNLYNKNIELHLNVLKNIEKAILKLSNIKKRRIKKVLNQTNLSKFIHNKI